MPSSSSTVVSDLACSTAYDMRLNAYGDGTTLLQEWGAYARISSLTTDLCPPPPPTLSPTPSRTQASASISLEWEDIPGASNYEVQRTAPGSLTRALFSTQTTGNSYLMGALTPDTGYNVQIKSYGNGWGAWSDPMTIFTGAPSPPQESRSISTRATSLDLSSDTMPGVTA